MRVEPHQRGFLMSCTRHATSGDHANAKRERGIRRFHLGHASGHSMTSVGHAELSLR